MRVVESVKWFVLIPFYPSMPISDRFRLAYYYLKSLLNRFILKRTPSNRLISVKFAGEPLYFRDNWFDPRSVYTVFSNDYNGLDKNIFKGIKTFVDVGANLGFISRCARTVSPDCKIVCFEPLSENAKLCRLNNPSIKVENISAGSKEGKMKLLVDDSCFMASSLRFGYHQTKREVRVATLDSYFNDIDYSGSIDLVKIDVEGMELEVVAGAPRILRKSKTVVAEVHSKNLLERFRRSLGILGFKEERTNKIEDGIYLTVWQNAGF